MALQKRECEAWWKWAHDLSVLRSVYCGEPAATFLAKPGGSSVQAREVWECSFLSFPVSSTRPPRWPTQFTCSQCVLIGCEEAPVFIKPLIPPKHVTSKRQHSRLNSCKNSVRVPWCLDLASVQCSPSPCGVSQAPQCEGSTQCSFPVGYPQGVGLPCKSEAFPRASKNSSLPLWILEGCIRETLHVVTGYVLSF